MSLIKNKFIYEKLTRVEINGKRKYETPGGTPVASVTTILGETNILLNGASVSVNKKRKR